MIKFKLNPVLVSCSTNDEVYCYGQVFETFETHEFASIFSNIYLMLTVSSCVHSNNLKRIKTPKTPSCAFLKTG